MKTTRRIYALAAAAAIMLGCAGCSGDSSAAEESEKTAETTPTKETAETKETTDQAETKETTEQTETTEPDEQSSGNTTSNSSNRTTDGVIVVSGEFDAVPEEYPWIAADEFQSAFDEFHAKASVPEATSMTYDEVEAIFGAPGAYYADKDYNDGEYKYYKWFSDNKKDVLVTFKGDGMTYFAWTSGTITPSN